MRPDADAAEIRPRFAASPARVCAAFADAALGERFREIAETVFDAVLPEHAGAPA